MISEYAADSNLSEGAERVAMTHGALTLLCRASLVALLGCGGGGASDDSGDDDGTETPAPPSSTSGAPTGGAPDPGSASDSLPPADSSGTTAVGDPSSEGSDGGDTAPADGSSSDSTGSDAEPPPVVGCPIDILFVIENGFVQDTYQEGLGRAIGPFVDDLSAELPAGFDLHVGIARGSGFYTPGNSGGYNPSTCESNPDGTFALPTDSDTGVNGQQGRLFEHFGMNFFSFQTGDDPTGLGNWFEGAVESALTNSPHPESSTVTAAAAYALHPVNADSNEGFIRPDGVLLVFLASQFGDMTPAEVPVEDFILIMQEAKADCGGDDCIVTAGVLQSACYENPDATNTRLYDFMNGFGKPAALVRPWDGFSVVDYETDILGPTVASAIGATCSEVLGEAIE